MIDWVEVALRFKVCSYYVVRFEIRNTHQLKSRVNERAQESVKNEEERRIAANQRLTRQIM